MSAAAGGIETVSAPLAVSGRRVVGVIWRRELLRFWRQPVRIVAAIGTACLLWIVMGSGLGSSFQSGAEQGGYAAYLLPGAMTLVCMFTAIFSSISVIEDRQEGWLQSVLASPAPRWAIAAGKIAGGATVAWAQAAVLLPAAPLVGLTLSTASVLLALAALALTSIALTALGMLFAWRCETSSGFHAVMNLVFMPMWVLSGSLFPVSGAHPWMAWLLTINPLSWCTQAIRAPLIGAPSAIWFAATAAFAAAMVLAATSLVSRPSKPGR